MILVDFSQIAIGNIMKELQGKPNVIINVPMVRYMILNSIRAYNVRFRKEYGELVICCDARHSWRKNIFPQYKAHRKKERSKSKFDWVSIYESLNIIKEELETTFPYPVVYTDSAEGDDCIASLVFWTQENQLAGGNALTEPKPQRHIILSGDHDFQMLQQYEGVTQFDPVNKKELISKEPYEDVLMTAIVYGCKGDGVPRFLSDDNSMVRGERAKTIMTTKMEQWKKQTMEQIANDPYLTKDYAPEYLLNNMKRNKALVDLHQIPQEIQDEIIQNYLKQSGVRNRSQLMNYFVKHGLNKMIEKMGDF